MRSVRLARIVTGLVSLGVGVLGCGVDPMSLVGGSSTGGASCLELAQQYVDAQRDAYLCDPAAADPCGEQRPVATYLDTGDGEPVLDGLCWVSGSGYVNPAAVGPMDEVLARYEAAGCEIANCPGPAPREPTCVDDGVQPPHCG